MLTFEEARKIGVDACIDLIGRDFMQKHRNNSSSGYGDVDDYAYCFVGVSDQPVSFGTELWLTSGPEHQFPYQASCKVFYKDGEIEFFDCILPQQASA
mgnify:FL=1